MGNYLSIEDRNNYLKEKCVNVEEKITKGLCKSYSSSFNMISAKQKYNYKSSILEFLENKNIREVICGNNWGREHYFYRSDNGRYYTYAYKDDKVVSCSCINEENIRLWLDVSKFQVTEEENELKGNINLKRCNAINSNDDITFNFEDGDFKRTGAIDRYDEKWVEVQDDTGEIVVFKDNGELKRTFTTNKYDEDTIKLYEELKEMELDELDKYCEKEMKNFKGVDVKERENN